MYINFLRERFKKKKHKKKLTNVSLYVCMSAEKSKMLVFFYVFSPNSSLKDNFQNRGFMLDIHTYKLTFVSFFMFFFAPSPNDFSEYTDYNCDI